MNHLTRRRFLQSSLALAGALVVPPLRAAAATAPASLQGSYFVDQSGQPLFLLGANYEGPADRAWRMWDDELFNPALIAQDFDRAVAANLGVLRLFVQQSLADDIRRGRWSKLDRVLDLADQRRIRIILTFGDYWEPDLMRLAAIDAAVAGHYRGRPTILAYDLRNEPHFSDLALANYPPGSSVPLQDGAWVAAVGESIALQDIADYAASEQGQRDIPQRLNPEQAYVYANLLGAYRAFLQEGGAWARARSSTVVHYLSSPDSARWHPLKEALNYSLAYWIWPRLHTLRAADPNRPLTIGHVDSILASLSANQWLDYGTLHLYPAASTEGIGRSMALLEAVGRTMPDKPLVLGEFGFSTALVNEPDAAALEVATVLAVRVSGGAGALKWMLNDFPNGANPTENAFGLYRADGSAKPSVSAFQGLGDLRPLARPTAAAPAS